MLRITLVLNCVVATACVGQGEMGEMGEEGPPGMAGPPGGGLVWKDASGAVVPNAHAAFYDASFAMTVSDANGVFFGFNSLNGVPDYHAYNTNSLQRFYLSNNCTGPARYSLGIAPGVAFKYDGRVIALPPDVDVAATVGSTLSGSCYPGTTQGAFIAISVLDMLPTLTPPLIGPGPYHVEKM